jgi:hypothetical protein
MTIFNNYRSWESYNVVPKQSLLGWMNKKKSEKFWIYRISLLLQKETSYESKLFAIAKFVKQGIPVFVKST